jgi:hypothetical protein
MTTFDGILFTDRVGPLRKRLLKESDNKYEI